MTDGKAGLPLDALLKRAGIPHAEDAGTAHIGAVVNDSRKGSSSSLFVAIPGFAMDGHDFLPAAVAAGCPAVIVERMPEVALPVPAILVLNARRAFALLNAALYGNPSHEMTVVGITGTDGKSTVTNMIRTIWDACGIPAASFTTIGHTVHGTFTPNAGHVTTQEADVLQKELREARSSGCTHVALETSSHALALDRVYGIAYRAAVFTRITSEHLELHGTREAYREAKGLLLTYAHENGGFGVLNRDDPFSYPYLSSLTAGRNVSYTTEDSPEAEYRATGIRHSHDSLEATFHLPQLTEHAAFAHLRGTFNIENALAALAVTVELGADPHTAIRALAAMEAVAGRMEHITTRMGIEIVIDFAHTEASLRKVLTDLRASTGGDIWVVFGSAGERDAAKRLPMGRVAGELADHVILANEDPRREDPSAILNDIASGVKTVTPPPKELRIIEDRTEAIRHALRNASPGDAVLLAGKGHEATITIGQNNLPWNEKEITLGLLKELDPLPPDHESG